MKNNKDKKLSLEDLRLESFLTELDENKLMKVQGGMGGYELNETADCTIDCSNDCSDACPTKDTCTNVGCCDGMTIHC